MVAHEVLPSIIPEEAIFLPAHFFARSFFCPLIFLLAHFFARSFFALCLLAAGLTGAKNVFKNFQASVQGVPSVGRQRWLQSLLRVSAKRDRLETRAIRLCQPTYRWPNTLRALHR